MSGSNRARDRLHDTPWYLDPDRLCKGKPEYADIDLVVTIPKGRGYPKAYTRKEQLADMATACLSCPVFEACGEALERETPKWWERYGVRAGRIYKGPADRKYM